MALLVLEKLRVILWLRSSLQSSETEYSFLYWWSEVSFQGILYLCPDSVSVASQREWLWLEAKSWHSCSAGLWLSPFLMWVEGSGTKMWNQSQCLWGCVQVPLQKSTKPGGMTEAWPELELLLGIFICFLKNPPTLGPWALLVVRVDDASPKETAMWKNCSSQSWDHVLWWQSVWSYSSWQSDLLNFQFLLWE